MRFPGRSSRSGPASRVRRSGTTVVSAFIMPCGSAAGCARIGRDDLCDNFFAMNRLQGHALRRHVAAAARRRLAARDVLDGRPRRVRGRAGDRRLPAAGRPAARRIVRARLRGLHGVRRRPPRRRPARRRARRGRRRRRRRPQHHPDRAGVRRVADHRGRRARRQARGRARARRDRRRQRGDRATPPSACAS